MAVRTKRIVIWEGSAGGAGVSLFTCPAGRTAIIKSMALYNLSGASTEMIVSLRSGNSTVRVVRQTVANNVAVRLDGTHWVLEPGDELRVAATPTANPVNVGAWGALLLGSPT